MESSQQKCQTYQQYLTLKNQFQEKLQNNQLKEFYIISNQWLNEWENYIQDFTGNNYIQITEINRDLVQDYIFQPQHINSYLQLGNHDINNEVNIIFKPNLQPENHYSYIDLPLFEFFQQQYSGIKIQRILYDLKNKNSSAEIYPKQVEIVMINTCILDALIKGRYFDQDSKRLNLPPLQKVQELKQELAQALQFQFHSNETYIQCSEQIFHPNQFTFNQIRLWKFNEISTLNELYDHLRQIIDPQNILTKKLNVDGIAKFFNPNNDSFIQDIDISPGQLIIAEFRQDGQNWILQGQNVPDSISEQSQSQPNIPAGTMGMQAAAAAQLQQQGQPAGALPQQQHQVVGAQNDSNDNSDENINIKQNLGLCGLGNMGNTCYMNSALQCLFQVEELHKFLISGIYQQEINQQNILGSKGQLINALAELFQKMHSTQKSYKFPKKFKVVFSNIYQLFEGYDQHDSQEFLSFLLDGIHEDINRVKQKKPQSEIKQFNLQEDLIAKYVWKQHIERNQSFVVDLFQGILKSEITCQTCKKTSKKFDPFMTYPISIPEQKNEYLKIHLCFTDSVKNQRIYYYPFQSNQQIFELKEHLYQEFDIRSNRQLITISNYQKIYPELDNDRELDEIKKKIQNEQEFFCFIISENDEQIDQNNRVQINISQGKKIPYENDYQISYFTHVRPFIFDLFCTLENIHQKIFEFYMPCFQKKFPEIQELNPKEAFYKFYIEQPDSIPYKVYLKSSCNQFNDTTCCFCGFYNCQNCELPVQTEITLQDLQLRIPENFEIEIIVLWSRLPLQFQIQKHNNYFHLLESKIQQEDNKNNNYDDNKKPYQQENQNPTLEECFQLTKEPELLFGDDKWFCPICKEHQNAKKTIEIFRAPKILILHLKRFQFKQSYNGQLIEQKKIQTKIDFPVQNLDLKKYSVQHYYPTDYHNDELLKNSFIPPNYNNNLINQTYNNLNNNNIYENQYQQQQTEQQLLNNDNNQQQQHQQQQVQLQQQQQQHSLKYDLFGVVNHNGTMQGGHYITYAKSFQYGKWFQFDDSSVTTIEQSKIVTDKAYLLFYRRKD